MRKWNHKRKSRAGQDSHLSGNHVRHAAPAEEPESEPAAHPTAKPITLPKLSFLDRKKIGGELL